MKAALSYQIRSDEESENEMASTFVRPMTGDC